jgi:cyclopropane fatty-acyl-phospholipid synthase-like methyltransferase
MTEAPQSASASASSAAHESGHSAEAHAVPDASAHTHDEQVPTSTHGFEDIQHWSKVFDDPARAAWQRPAEVVAALALEPDDVVVDLGTGTGYFVEHLARAVPRGKVLAIDTEPRMLSFVAKRAERSKLDNVETRLAGGDDPKLREQVDLVLVVDTYHHIGKRTAYFQRLAPRLSEAGRVVIVDWKLGKFPIGPPDSHKLAPEVVQREFEAGGYERCSSSDRLPYQYVLTFALRCPSAKAPAKP